MDILRHYSNHPDLLEDLTRLDHRLQRALHASEPAPRRSVTSTGRTGRNWSLYDRLNEDEVRGIVAGFQAGQTKKKLAEQYNISQSSIKRILRRHRIAALMVEHTVTT